MAPRSQNVPAVPDIVRYRPQPKRYVLSCPLNALGDKLLSRRVAG